VANDIRTVFNRGGGVATAAELREIGVSREMLRRWVRQGKLATIAHGVYTLPTLLAAAADDPRWTHALEAAAIIRRGAGLVTSHASAAFLHGLETLGTEDEPPQVCLTRSPATNNRYSGKIAELHVASLPPEHVSMFRGVPVTTVARTVIDIARAESFLDGVVIADSALRSSRWTSALTTQAELAYVARECAGWPGTAQAREAIQFADSRSESALESLARVRFRDCGLEPPNLQVNVTGVHGFIGRVDFCWWQQRTIAEADGAIKYNTDATRRARDQLRRDELLREASWAVVHFTWHEIFHKAERVVARIRANFR
jgi:predicted transcriptional regulator of viral defense system/very-short-patch-repair endonuclease